MYLYARMYIQYYVTSIPILINIMYCFVFLINAHITFLKSCIYRGQSDGSKMCLKWDHPCLSSAWLLLRALCDQ